MFTLRSPSVPLPVSRGWQAVHGCLEEECVVTAAVDSQPACPPGTDAAGIGRVMDELPFTRFHRRAVVVSGMGFFTDAYDLFVIGTALTLLKGLWHLSASQVSLIGSATLLGAFLGALGFGRLADRLGRKSIYAVVAVLMIIGALLSAFATGIAWLVAARFILGLGIGGDYPVSGVLASEFSNRADRGRMVGMVFSMQAVGLIVGPLVGLAVVGSGVQSDTAWRLMLAFGALPAAAVLYLRTRMPESPRFTAHVRGREADAAADLRALTGPAPEVGAPALTVLSPRSGPPPATAGAAAPSAPSGHSPHRRLLDRRMLTLLIGTAGSWFLLDYAYYGNTLSTPLILKQVAPGASLLVDLAWTLLLFVVFAAPGYVLAVWRMDRLGHRRLQLIGFAAMAVCFGLLGLWPGLTTAIVPFLIVYGISYFFSEFGPNTTTFVLPTEVFPTSLRTTGHGVAAGVGKLGAFIGVFLFPVFNAAFGLRGSLLVAGIAAVAGLLVTRLLPEPARRSLEDVSGERVERSDAAA
jgi:PHS family inorganic phosphate transporter-like MFS transporter